MLTWLLLAGLHNPVMRCEMECHCPEAPPCGNSWSWSWPIVSLDVSSYRENIPAIDLRAFAELQREFGKPEQAQRRWMLSSPTPLVGWSLGWSPGPDLVILPASVNYRPEKPSRWSDFDGDWDVDLADYQVFHGMWR